MKKVKIRNKSEIRIKLGVIAGMLILLILSFFFAESIERFLGINQTYARNEVETNELEDSFKVCYIDVGQGNCTLVQLPDGKTILIDGGSTSYGSKIYEYLTELGIETIDYLIATHADTDHIGGLNYLFDKFEIVNIFRPFQICGTGTSTATFTVYKDEDLASVYNSYIELLGNKTKISRVTSSVYKTFITNIYSETYTDNGVTKSSKVTVFYDGLEIVGENYSLKFYFPESRDDAEPLENLTSNTYGYATKGYGVNESNGNSAIFLLTIYDYKFMFTGDAPFSSGSTNDSTEDENSGGETLTNIALKNLTEIVFIFNYNTLDENIILYSDSSGYEELDFIASLTSSEIKILSGVDVYLLGHHGSKYSSSEELLQILNPRFAVISVGENNYGHPSSEVLERIAKLSNIESDYLLRTDENGTITFGLKNSNLVYALENSSDVTKLTLSWYELGFVIFLVLSFLVVCIRPYKKCNDTIKRPRIKEFGEK